MATFKIIPSNYRYLLAVTVLSFLLSCLMVGYGILIVDINEQLIRIENDLKIVRRLEHRNSSLTDRFFLNKEPQIERR